MFSCQIIHKSQLRSTPEVRCGQSLQGLKFFHSCFTRKREKPTEFVHELCLRGINVHCWIFSRCYLNNLKCGFLCKRGQVKLCFPAVASPFRRQPDGGKSREDSRRCSWDRCKTTQIWRADAEKKNGIITPNLFDINLNYWPDEPSVNP